MPELGEVEIARLNLEKWWVGRSASEIAVLDEAVFTSGGTRAPEVFATQAVAAKRRGKYLWVEFSQGDVVLFHFRMTGQITRHSDTEARFTRLAWRLGDHWLCFRDARRLGHVDVFSSAEFAAYQPIAQMGPEPWDVDGEDLRTRVGKRMLKAALMDQSVVAGVGNIAVSEVFWAQKLKPEISGPELTKKQWAGLAKALQTFFEAVVQEQASDEMVYVNQGGENPFSVYGRLGEPCPNCGTEIQRSKVAGRSSYFCPKCQR